MLPTQITRALQARDSGVRPLVVRPAGEGDYCTAVRVNDDWMVLRARHAHASECLDRVARLTPLFASDAPTSVPVVELHGHVDGLAWVAYRAVPGEPLAAHAALLRSPEGQSALVRDLAAFFRHLHGFDVRVALELGVPSGDYAFAMREDTLDRGPASELYERDLADLEATGLEEPTLMAVLRAGLDRHLERLAATPDDRVLLHGEVSGDHVLLDPASGRMTGVIDFNGMTVGRPAREFLYLYEEAGEAFTVALLRACDCPDLDATIRELRFLRAWHTLLRVMWCARHGAAELLERRRAELRRYGRELTTVAE